MFITDKTYLLGIPRERISKALGMQSAGRGEISIEAAQTKLKAAFGSRGGQILAWLRWEESMRMIHAERAANWASSPEGIATAQQLEEIEERIRARKEKWAREELESQFGRVGAYDFDLPHYRSEADEAADEYAVEKSEREAEELYLQTVRHEVGHATIVLARGGEVCKLIARRDGSGLCQHDNVSARDYPLVLAAGYIASNQASGLASDGCGGDREQLHAAMRAIGITGDDASLREHAYQVYEPTVQNILGEHWEFRAALTTELHDRGTMSGAEVHALWNRFHY